MNYYNYLRLMMRLADRYGVETIEPIEYLAIRTAYDQRERPAALQLARKLGWAPKAPGPGGYDGQ